MNRVLPTMREQEILSKIADGQSNKWIAAELNISEQTVKNHVSSLLNKYHAVNRIDLLTKVREHDGGSLMLQIGLLRMSPLAKIPTRGTIRSAYYDLYAAESSILTIGNVTLVTTGWKIEMPEGYFLDLRPRSGMAAKGILLANASGTLDEDYRGELKIELLNLTGALYYVKEGDRIAQCARMPMLDCDFVEVERLSDTFRGEKGYGSTGR